MSRDSVYLLDILLKAAKLAIGYLKGKSRKEFLKDTQCQDAVIRRLEIIGEAARRISRTTAAKFPNIPWTKVRAMRNIIVHEYDDVDLAIVWNTVRSDLPSLISLSDQQSDVL